MLLLTNLWGQALGGALGAIRSNLIALPKTGMLSEMLGSLSPRIQALGIPVPSWAQRTGKWHPLPQMGQGSLPTSILSIEPMTGSPGIPTEIYPCSGCSPSEPVSPMSVWLTCSLGPLVRPGSGACQPIRAGMHFRLPV